MPKTPLRVLVTRPAAQAQEWVQQLRAAGLSAQALPLIGIEAAPDGGAALRSAWAALAAPPSSQPARAIALVMFVSPNAVAYFFAQRPAWAAWPLGAVAASPGPGTTQALRAQGVPASCITEPAADSPQFDSEALWLQLRHQNWAGRHVLMVRGTGGRDWLAQQLAVAGATVNFVAAYQRSAPQFNETELALLGQALAAPKQSLWFFSSSEAVDHLAHAVQQRQLLAAWPRAQALATHPRIAERARALGIAQVHECRPALAAVVACIQSFAS